MSRPPRRRCAGLAAGAGRRGSTLAVLAVLTLSVPAALTGGAMAQPADAPPAQTLDFEFDSFAFEAGRWHIRNLRSTRGELSVRADEALVEEPDTERSEWLLQGNVRISIPQGSIEADEARGEGLDFARSEWRFAGNVRIMVGTARLEADEGRFVFEDDRLAVGELTGTPATFGDRGAEGSDPARGTADRIRYDTSAGTLRLSGDVTVHQERSEYSGCDLVYDFAREQVTAGSSEDCEEPLHIRIQVPGDDGAGPPAAP